MGFFSSLSFAAPANKTTTIQEFQVPVRAGEQAYVLSRLLNDELPTVILLPGIFRGFLPDENVLQVLNRRKLNWVAWHTSRHPESLMTTHQNPWLKQVSVQDLADELVALKRALKIKHPILVSLSYSASLIPFVNPKEFPVVIETAPMGTSTEENPPPPYYQAWKQWMGLFPVWGNMVVQNQEYWAYRGYWMQQAQELTKSHPNYGPFQRIIAEGLAQLAFASREFDLRNQDFTKGPLRYWILGQKENRTRKSIQLQAIRLYEEQTKRSGTAFEIEGAGHVVPNEQPEAYVKALSELVQKISK